MVEKSTGSKYSEVKAGALQAYIFWVMETYQPKK